MGFVWAEGPKQIVRLPEASSQTFVTGDLLYPVSGKLTIATSTSQSTHVALKPATGTVDTMIEALEILPGTRFLCQASATTAQTNVGLGYDLVYTSGSCAVNPSSTTNEDFIIDQLHPSDGATTGAGGRVYGHFDTVVMPLTYDVA
jgi:hypothetical protein